MNASDKLTGFVNQAASAITLLSPTKSSEVEELKEIFSQIDQALGKISDAPAQLLTQAVNTSGIASAELEKILQQEEKDTQKSVDAVSQAICSLQQIIDQIVEPCQAKADPQVTEPPVKPVEKKPAPSKDVFSTDSSAPKGIVVPEEDVPLVLDFIAEANEHIENSEAGLLNLESKPDDQEVLNLIFRAFHTIKGMAGFLNLADIGSLAHSAENILDLARKGELKLVGPNSDVIFESIDMLKKLICGLKESVEASKEFLSLPTLPALIAKLKDAAEKKDKEKAEDVKNEQAEDVSASKPETDDQNKAVSKGHETEEKIKVSTTRLDNLVNMAGELVIAQLMVAEEINKTLFANHDLGRKVAQQSKIVRELQELSMSMRMVPISGVFQKMARLVRDVSHKAGKDIKFVTEGEDTELDRTVVDKIADPLVHMIRNSVDHGVESPDERKKAGKNPTAKVELRAFHKAGNIVIEIEDDGKGLNKERILQKAVENGIVNPGQELSDDEIYKLIYHAGLSTAQQVTSISGRGVGMDVVRKNIDALRGRIDIISTPGKGSIFTISLPLTIAIIDGQVIKSGNERYLIPINSIVQSFKPAEKQISSVNNRSEMVLVRGELLPLVRLYRLFKVTPVTEDPTKGLL
ncbi:MAG: chemotaxis protein CheA, partial [Candidatus Brocadiia bacterium]